MGACSNPFMPAGGVGLVGLASLPRPYTNVGSASSSWCIPALSHPAELFSDVNVPHSCTVRGLEPLPLPVLSWPVFSLPVPQAERRKTNAEPIPTIFMSFFLGFPAIISNRIISSRTIAFLHGPRPPARLSSNRRFGLDERAGTCRASAQPAPFPPPQPTPARTRAPAI